MNLKTIIGNIMDSLADRTSGADVNVSVGWSSRIDFTENKLANISSNQQTLSSLRVIKDGKFGVSATNQVNAAGINKMVEDSLTVAEFGRKVNFTLPKRYKGKLPIIYDPMVEKLTEEELIGIGNNLITQILSQTKGFSVTGLTVERSFGKSYFINTEGAEEESQFSEISFGLEIANIKDGDFFRIYYGNDMVRNELSINDILNKILVRIKDGQRAITPPGGIYPVIFTPEAVGDWLDFILTATSGRTTNEKTSKLTSKLGKQEFDKRLTIIDDPTVDWQTGSYGLDDEGVPGQKKYLIKDGVVSCFYYDLNQANKAKTESTGNGSRGGFSQAEPSVSNIIVSGGNQEYGKLLAGIKRGLVVYGSIGSGQNNPYNGDFQLTVQLGYWVNNGQIVGRVKNTAISGNVFELLKNRLSWISKDRETLGNLTVPYVCFDKVTVTSG